MKEGERTILGYLAAFTLGVVCMGVIALLLMRAKPTPTAPEIGVPAVPQEEVPPPPAIEPRRQTFQRIPRSAVSPAVDAPPVEEPATAAAAPGEAVENEVRPVVVVPVVEPVPVHSASTPILPSG